MYKIAVDIQGADSAPCALAAGVVRALSDDKDLRVVLPCNAAEIKKLFDGDPDIADRLEIIDAPETVTNSEPPVEAFEKKKNSSLVKGLELCGKDADIGAFVTCGATGAIFVTAMMTLEKIGSPVLLAELRKANGVPFCIADCGANVDCRADKLVHFARMGVAYMKTLGVGYPRVALLSNGAENGKGNALTKKAYELLTATDLNFIGNVEGTGILTNDADVVVCEGFSGNILLKTIEGSAKAVLGESIEMFDKIGLSDDRREEMKRVYKRLYNQYDYTSLGGAVLLGFKTPIIKGHGAASAETVYHIIKNASALVKNRLICKIEEELKR